ncbi:hypothetical protein GCM10027449_10560 [Sinomonas notoginsengisoli]|uniref:hypothetical protein n=1 Tax=Sinomonas notoginsengisoli TaxID=1457311 RepID=UPI001F4677AE|nr:hypothetical protein [Sinomonas notoginsengisoli]
MTVEEIARTAAQKVIARDGAGEIHGYAVGSGSGRVYVVWEVASGRRRQRGFRAEEVFVPGHSLPWSGIPISLDQLTRRRGIRL